MSSSSPFIPNADLQQLDELLNGQNDDRWDAFYSDRARPCPFFVDSPDESLAQWVVDGSIRPGRALDLGCGSARNAIFLARNGFNVEAVDYSVKAVEWARERVAQTSVGQADLPVTVIQANVFELDLRASQYDLVYDSGCFHHIAPHRRSQYVDLVANALKPGGWFGLTCFRPEGGSGYSDNEVYEKRSLGGGLGYTDDRLREFWSAGLDIRQLRQMKKQSPSSGLFGETFLWAMLAQKKMPLP